jgi:hypothetical protein
MTGFKRSLAVMLLLCLPLSAWGHGVGHRTRSVAHYAPVVVQYVPMAACVPIVPVCPVPAPAPFPSANQAPRAAEIYARPSPAPPSATPATPAPPLAVPEAPRTPAPASPRRNSDVRESQSYYDSYAGTPPDSAKPAGDRCTVGFWNLSAQDLTIKIDGQARSLPRGQNVQLGVGRQFFWQIEGREARQESIARGESALEIVIRR